MEIKIIGSDEPGVHVGKLGRILLALSRGEKIEQVVKPEPVEPEPVFGPTNWTFGRGTFSEKLNVTSYCARCKHGMAFYSLEALAAGFQHCAKIEHAPENLVAQWKEQEAQRPV